MTTANVGEVRQVWEKVTQETALSPREGECRHHWLIESPHGATREGICKLCGDVRQFSNSLASMYWEGDSLTDTGRWGRRSATLAVSLDDEDGLSTDSRGELALTS
jgi:hypothetical protein